LKICVLRHGPVASERKVMGAAQWTSVSVPRLVGALCSAMYCADGALTLYPNRLFCEALKPSWSLIHCDVLLRPDTLFASYQNRLFSEALDLA
jgi:hypothetical protein